MNGLLSHTLALVAILASSGYAAAGTGAPGEEVHLRDPALESAVRAAFAEAGIESGEVVKVQQLSDPRFITLSASGLGIRHLEGLEHAVHLERLDLSHNEIVDISPLAALQQLRWLDLGCGDPALAPDIPEGDELLDLSYTNQLTSIEPLRPLVHLEYLNLAGNTGISDIEALRTLTELKSVWLAQSNISSFAPLAALHRLQVLGIANCRLETEDLGALAALNSLHTIVIRSEPGVLSLASLEGLDPRALRCKEVPVESLDFVSGWKSLETLYLVEGRIGDLRPVETLPRLKWLNLGDNQVADLEPLRALRSTLEVLDLEGNRITDISPVNDLIALTSLELDTNAIEDIHAIEGLLQLKEISISSNRVRDIAPLALVPDPEHIDIRNNLVQDLEPLVRNINAGDRATDWLDVNGNRLTQESRCIHLPALVERFERAGAEIHTDPEQFCGPEAVVTIVVRGEGRTIPPAGEYIAPLGSPFTIAAEPVSGSGHAFSHFAGDVSGSDTWIEPVLNGDTTVEAVFVPGDVRLTVEISGNGNSEPAAGTYAYLAGRTAHLRSWPAEGHFFGGWHGDYRSASPEIEIQMDRDRAVVAEFDEEGHVLDLRTWGAGTLNIRPAMYLLAHEMEIDIEAMPTGEGWQFVRWEGDTGGIDVHSPRISVRMERNRLLTAVFIAAWRLHISMTGPQGKTVPTPGEHVVPHGETVTLSAQNLVEKGSAFLHWDGDIGLGSPDSPEITLLMDQDREVIARFGEARRLTVETVGPGVTVPAPGEYAHVLGEEVILKPLSLPDGAFLEWQGDLTDARILDNGQVAIRLDSDRLVTALFGPAMVQLNLGVKGTGEGQLNLPAGVQGFSRGDTVLLMAKARPGHYFHRWVGDIDEESPFVNRLCLRMNRYRQVIAEFRAPRQVTIFADGPAASTNPQPGIYYYKDQTYMEMRVTDIPSGVRFIGWRGDVPLEQRQATQLRLFVDRDMQIVAHFQEDTTSSATQSAVATEP